MKFAETDACFFKRERVLERVFKPLIRLKLTGERLES